MPGLYDQLLNNPMLQLGAGLLTGGQPGGTFAGGLNMGLMNLANMQRQQQATALLGAQIQQMQWKRQQAEAKARAELLQQQQDAFRAAALGILPGGSETAQQSNAYALSGGDPAAYQKQLAELTKKGPLATQTTIIGGGETPQINYLSDAEKRSLGLNPASVYYSDPKTGVPKLLQEGEKGGEEFRKLEVIESSFDKYRSTLNRVGPQIFASGDKLELDSAYGDIMVEAKNLFELGALQKPDMDLMERVLKDPTNAINAGLYSKEDFLQQLKGFEAKLDAARAFLERKHGRNAPAADNKTLKWSDL